MKEPLESKTMNGIFVLRRLSGESTLIMGIVPFHDARSDECIEAAKESKYGLDEFVYGVLMWAAVYESATSDLAIGHTHESLLMHLGEHAKNAFAGVTRGEESQV